MCCNHIGKTTKNKNTPINIRNNCNCDVEKGLRLSFNVMNAVVRKERITETNTIYITDCFVVFFFNFLKNLFLYLLEKIRGS